MKQLIKIFLKPNLKKIIFFLIILLVALSGFLAKDPLASPIAMLYFFIVMFLAGIASVLTGYCLTECFPRSLAFFITVISIPIILIVLYSFSSLIVIIWNRIFRYFGGKSKTLEIITGVIILISVFLLIFGGFTYWNFLRMRDLSRCDRISHQTAKNTCYYEVARVRKDPSICDKIQYIPQRESCHKEF